MEQTTVPTTTLFALHPFDAGFGYGCQRCADDGVAAADNGYWSDSNSGVNCYACGAAVSDADADRLEACC